MPQPFPGLSEADFDAYLPARATSNAFVRPRLEVKQKLLALGRELAERARAAGHALEVTGSDERPSIWNKKSVTEQWVFLWRDRDARAELERAGESERRLDASLLDPTPYYKHAFLALRLDAERFEVALRVHRDAWADIKTLRRRLESADGRGRLEGALAALPESFTVGVTGGEQHAARGLGAERFGALVEAAVAQGSWLAVARGLERADVVARGAELGELVQQAFDALLPMYAVAAWRRDDDAAAVEEDLARERAAREAQAAEAAAREAEWNARHTAEIERRREQALTEARERLAALEPARPAAVQAATAALAAEAQSAPSGRGAREGGAPPRREGRDSREQHAARGARAGAPRGQAEREESRAYGEAMRAQGQPRPSTPTPAPRVSQTVELGPESVRVGARVKILAGPFAGKVGTVLELDTKGQARVSLGLLSARVESRELVALAERE